MGLDSIAVALADAAFAPGTKRNMVSWVSSPNRVSITGRLRGSNKKGIVVTVRDGNNIRMSVHAPSNITCATVCSEVSVDEHMVMRFARSALDDIRARQTPRQLPFLKRPDRK